MARPKRWSDERADRFFEDDDLPRSSPWEKQAGRAARRAPRCQREYDMASKYERRYRREAKFHCTDASKITEAVEAAFVGKCQLSRRLLGKAKCRR